VLACVAAAAFLVPRPATRQGQRAGGPIVIISVDTLRADHVSAYGRRGGATPAIDALAADGVLFERAYSHAPQTLPAHASILTGRLPYRHGVRDNVGFTLPASEVTLPAMLRRAGYRSAAFVSAYVMRSETGIGRQFDVYDASLPPALATSMGGLRRDGGETLAAADAWLADQRDPRFLLFVHLYEPHRPWRAPSAPGSRGTYAGAVAQADALVGRLVERLRARGVYDEATIVFLSDHGEGLGDHGEEEHGVFLYDEAIRVPLIVKLPAARRAGTRIAIPVQHVDLVPTLLDLATIPRPPHTLDGASLASLLTGASGRLPERAIYGEALYSHYHFGWSELYSLTDARFRFIQAPAPELYDLGTDPGERRNLAASRAAALAGMARALSALGSGPASAPSAVSTEERERLQALGYIGTGGGPAASTGHRVDPKDQIQVLERYREGVRLAGERRFEEARSVLRQVLADRPEMVDVWTQLGHVELRAGRHASGIEALEKAVSLAPTATETILAVAGAHLRVGALDRAAGHARVALDRDPAGAHEVLARVALARGRGQEALAEARLAEQADPGLPMPAFIQGVILYNARRYEEAVPLLQQAAARLGPRRLALRDLHFSLGDSLAHAGRDGEAEAALRRELEVFPENSRARASLALLYAAQGRQADAVRALREIIATTPTAESYALAARTLQVVGDARGAEAVAEQGLRAFPSSADLRRLAGRGR
jgi:arylsulfatase A-like enzyme/Tfp pilus assembly protein PilF